MDVSSEMSVDASAQEGRGEQTAAEVLGSAGLPSSQTPFGRASRDFLYGQVWSRPGLSRRDRRFVTLTCVAAADAPEPIEEQVRAALASGDISLDEMLELVLHFAVYCGWPKASHLEGAIARQWDRIHRERGEPTPPWPELDNLTLGPGDMDKRIARGVEEFIDVNLTPAPPVNSPYRQAGILNFVFGHVWQRPGLTRRERRIITVASVALDDSPVPLRTHVAAALHSGDITKEEMDEIVLQFAAYYGFAKGDALADSVEAAWAGRPA
ncbi:4-carboxymuconolactone decarboxylase [Streptomyces sp. SAI-144]|uniref:carboxymuconolactone decarboxylase family protein n=3 Tax=unclassified Streptomyces TaxID=2593676 RepID=UPI00247442D5|nr:carboxymuconolactone decarboxylase family protein [Streptomyces sp. SAI-144]MDH6436659.1 4-carboxymuconolactone decarboxylase [Streptomyces sp. SAI-144]